MKRKNIILSGALLLGMLATLGHKPLHAYYGDGDSAARGAFFGGLTGTAIGGAAGGWKGAAIGGVAGFGLGGMIGASRSRRRDPQYKLNKLYRKQDRLQRNFKKAKSDKRRNRIQHKLDQVQDEIKSYERHYGMRHA